mmetsp:Transcript_16880/g.43407  ORF Transcript_16880/g.43407 Transcript_16880/m.43407 type:complete len:538 (+) Transcript_16880:1380-2993(+)
MRPLLKSNSIQPTHIPNRTPLDPQRSHPSCPLDVVVVAGVYNLRFAHRLFDILLCQQNFRLRVLLLPSEEPPNDPSRILLQKPWVPQHLVHGWPLLRVPLAQHLLEEVLELLADSVRDLDLILADLLLDLRWRFPHEWHAAAHHEVEQRDRGPRVHRVVLLGHHRRAVRGALLRRQERDLAVLRSHHRDARQAVLDLLGVVVRDGAERVDLDGGVDGEEELLRPDVAVDDAAGVEVGEARENVLDEEPRHFLLQRPDVVDFARVEDYLAGRVLVDRVVAVGLLAVQELGEAEHVGVVELFVYGHLFLGAKQGREVLVGHEKHAEEVAIGSREHEPVPHVAEVQHVVVVDLREVLELLALVCLEEEIECLALGLEFLVAVEADLCLQRCEAGQDADPPLDLFLLRHGQHDFLPVEGVDLEIRAETLHLFDAVKLERRGGLLAAGRPVNGLEVRRHPDYALTDPAKPSLLCGAEPREEADENVQYRLFLRGSLHEMRGFLGPEAVLVVELEGFCDVVRDFFFGDGFAKVVVVRKVVDDV